MDCNLTVKNFSLRFSVVYRPPPNKQNGLKTSTFLDDEWPTVLANFTTAENDILVVGDVNFHLDNLSNPNTQYSTVFWKRVVCDNTSPSQLM